MCIRDRYSGQARSDQLLPSNSTHSEQSLCNRLNLSTSDYRPGVKKSHNAKCFRPLKIPCFRLILSSINILGNNRGLLHDSIHRPESAIGFPRYPGKAVSYTHLDVYKRQILYCYFNILLLKKIGTKTAKLGY